jgi:hypothetical protein
VLALGASARALGLGLSNLELMVLTLAALFGARSAG